MEGRWLEAEAVRRSSVERRRAVRGVSGLVLILGSLFVVSELDKGPDTSHAFAFLQTQDSGSEPVTYDPCVPIYLSVDDRTAVDDGMRLLDEAAEQVADATGLTLVVATAPPEGDYAPVLVSWTDPVADEQLEGSIVGGGGSDTSTYNGRRWFVTGQVNLDGPQLAKIMKERHHGREQVRAVIMHELGHVVGLNHVKTPGQVMQPEMHERVTTWGDGDRAGLKALGGGDCADG